MRTFFIAVLVVLASLCPADLKLSIDWRSTALTNWAMDTYQTSRFMVRRDVYWYEQNPLTKPLVESRNVALFAASSVAFSLSLDGWLQRQPKHVRDWAYPLWAVLHGLATFNNARRFGPGFTVMVWNVRF